MRKLVLLAMCLIACSAQAQTNQTPSWYEYAKVPLPTVKANLLNTKLKLLELVSLRQWEVTNQTLNSFQMTLDKCSVRIKFDEQNAVISHNGFKYSKRTICRKNWLSNVKKDVNATLRILSIQQEAINLDHNSHQVNK
ncbi:hypothetical protein [Vibrio rarus]|uniref:hypothetical protein n=1 Tax=Vibrio rarus TaxID=413403 RepID=UPI0021C2CD33|nr:hypothetical protein [Vibrio rarus]